MKSEQNVLATFTELLRELPKLKSKVHFCIGRKDASGSRTMMESSILIMSIPRDFDIVSVD
jgi:hypothetical protein